MKTYSEISNLFEAILADAEAELWRHAYPYESEYGIGTAVRTALSRELNGAELSYWYAKNNLWNREMWPKEYLWDAPE